MTSHNHLSPFSNTSWYIRGAVGVLFHSIRPQLAATAAVRMADRRAITSRYSMVIRLLLLFIDTIIIGTLVYGWNWPALSCIETIWVWRNQPDWSNTSNIQQTKILFFVSRSPAPLTPVHRIQTVEEPTVLYQVNDYVSRPGVRRRKDRCLRILCVRRWVVLTSAFMVAEGILGTVLCVYAEMLLLLRGYDVAWLHDVLSERVKQTKELCKMIICK